MLSAAVGEREREREMFIIENDVYNGKLIDTRLSSLAFYRYMYACVSYTCTGPYRAHAPRGHMATGHCVASFSFSWKLHAWERLLEEVHATGERDTHVRETVRSTECSDGRDVSDMYT